MSPPPSPPRLLDLVRQVAQTRFGQDGPGGRYAHWTHRLMMFHDKRHPRDLSPGDRGTEGGGQQSEADAADPQGFAAAQQPGGCPTRPNHEDTSYQARTSHLSLYRKRRRLASTNSSSLSKWTSGGVYPRRLVEDRRDKPGGSSRRVYPGGSPKPKGAAAAAECSFLPVRVL